jgi:hypothetical protein
MSQQPLVGQGLLIIEASRSHTLDTPQSVGLLWTSDQPVAETSTRQHTTLTTDIHALGGIRTRNPSTRTAADPCLRRRGHWDRPNCVYGVYFSLLGHVFDGVVIYYWLVNTGRDAFGNDSHGVTDGGVCSLLTLYIPVVTLYTINSTFYVFCVDLRTNSDYLTVEH